MWSHPRPCPTPTHTLPLATTFADAASKHATQAFCDCLRAELEQHGVAVTVLSPGYIRTNLSLNAIAANGSRYGGEAQLLFFYRKLLADDCLLTHLNVILKMKTHWVLVTGTAYQVTFFYPGPPTAHRGRTCRLEGGPQAEMLPVFQRTHLRALLDLRVPYPPCLRSN